MDLGLAGGLALLESAVIAAALLASGSRLRKQVALAVAMGGLALPWLSPHPIARAALAIAGSIGLFRVTDLVRARVYFPAWRRIAHALSWVDFRLLKRAPPHMDWVAVLHAIPWGLAGLGIIYLGTKLSFRASSLPFWGFRWGGALILVYCLVEFSAAMLGAAYGCLGLVCPILHRAPIASRSVQEFWGARWNRGISFWLRDTVFLPFARRGFPRTGLMASFFVSGSLHAYMILAGAGAGAAAMMMGFFLVQGALALLETKLGVARWSVALGRLWTISVMTLSSPLFLEPGLRLVNLAARR